MSYAPRYRPWNGPEEFKPPDWNDQQLPSTADNRRRPFGGPVEQDRRTEHPQPN